jgi:hypothetical protein
MQFFPSSLTPPIHKYTIILALLLPPPHSLILRFSLFYPVIFLPYCTYSLELISSNFVDFLFHLLFSLWDLSAAYLLSARIKNVIP